MRSEKSKNVNEVLMRSGQLSARSPRHLLKVRSRAASRPGYEGISMTHAPAGMKRTKPSMAKFKAKNDSKMKDTLTRLREATHYHSVFHKYGEGKWVHHFDADTKEDARAERESLKHMGGKVKVFRVPKKEANWTKRDPHEFVMSRLKEEVDLDEMAPTNAMGDSSGTTGSIRTYDPMVTRHRKRSGLLRRMVKGKFQTRGV